MALSGAIVPRPGEGWGPAPVGEAALDQVEDGPTGATRSEVCVCVCVCYYGVIGDFVRIYLHFDASFEAFS